MKRIKSSWTGLLLLLLFLAVGCASAPVLREAVNVDMSVPVGTIENDQFTGIRYPFKVSAPSHWEIATEYPKFMLDLGFEKEGLEESQVFIFSPETRSNLQIDLSPAGRHVKFDQKTITWLTTAAAGSLKEELKKEHGENFQVAVSPTEIYHLKGVPFAAKKSATYTVKGEKREHGWIYAFAEPYQIFIIYLVMEKGGDGDRQAIKASLESFEYLPKGTP
jgi:hypothetical protein